MPYKILFLGASYGSLLAAKLLPAGHTIKLVCLPNEVEVINKEGIRVRLPVKGREGLVEIDSRKLPGKISADGPGAVNPADYDLVALAMMEPQYRSPGVRELLDAVAKAKKPCMFIMNMPPLTYLKRIPGLNVDACRNAYADPTVWDSLDPKLMTLCSPDPQAFRPPDEKVNVLQVRLPTNFKAAKFESDAHTAILRQLEKEVEAARFDDGTGKKIELPVSSIAHFASGTNTESCTFSLTGNSMPAKRAASTSAASRRRIAVCASESKRADLKLVGSRTCSTFTFSSGGRKACGSGLHRVMKFGSKLSQTVGSV